MPTASPTQRLLMPKTNPGGMEAHIVPSRVPRVYDRVQMGPIGMPMDEFCQLVELALTTTPLRAGDPRRALIDRIQRDLYIETDDRVAWFQRPGGR